MTRNVKKPIRFSEILKNRQQFLPPQTVSYGSTNIGSGSASQHTFLSGALVWVPFTEIASGSASLATWLSGNLSWQAVGWASATHSHAVDSFVLRGAGNPEGSITAAVGTIFLRTDDSATTSLFIKQTGSGNTGWVGK